MATSRIASGISGTNWAVYAATGILIDVDTSAAKFNKAPVYVTSLYGDGSHWATTGGSAVYSPTATGFRIYVKWSDSSPLTPAQAVSFGWRVAWHGIED
jgi:hypothetical protein